MIQANNMSVTRSYSRTSSGMRDPSILALFVRVRGSHGSAHVMTLTSTKSLVTTGHRDLLLRCGNTRYHIVSLRAYREIRWFIILLRPTRHTQLHHEHVTNFNNLSSSH
jgi:hypothetical protein